MDGKNAPAAVPGDGADALSSPSCCSILIFVAVFKDTSLFNAKTFALSLVVATVVWMAAQARAHMKAKIFYVDPDSAKSEKPEKTGSKP